MRNQFFVWISILLLFAACKSNEPAEPAVKNEVKVTVYDTKTWSASSPVLKTVGNVTVNLSSKSYDVTAVTSEQGVVTFREVKEGGYSILATKGDLSNLHDQRVVNGVALGYLIVGVYQSQEDIDSSAEYSNAEIGGIKLADINGDGLINNLDLVSGDGLGYEFKYKDLNQDGIIDAKDVINGSLQKTDNQVEVNVYIGN